MKSVIDVVLPALNRIKSSRQPIKYLVLLDENLPFIHLPGSVTVAAKDFGEGVADIDLWTSLLEVSDNFSAILVISADHDFANLLLDYKVNSYKSKNPCGNISVEVIDLNQLSKRYLRRLGVKRPVAQSGRRKKISVIKNVYREWLAEQEEKLNE